MLANPDPAQTRLDALSRWDNEGGAGPLRTPEMDALHSATPALNKAELVQLRVRVIALENVLIALLASAPEAALAKVLALATAIQPRAGHTPHPLTLHAAEHMQQLVARAAHFKEIVE